MLSCLGCRLRSNTSRKDHSDDINNNNVRVVPPTIEASLSAPSVVPLPASLAKIVEIDQAIAATDDITLCLDSVIQAEFDHLTHLWGSEEMLVLDKGAISELLYKVLQNDQTAGLGCRSVTTHEGDGRKSPYIQLNSIGGGQFRGYRIAKRQDGRLVLYGHAALYRAKRALDREKKASVAPLAADLITELIDIGHAEGLLLPPRGSELLERVQSIGSALNDAGGKKLLLQAHEAVRDRLDATCAHELEAAWDGLGLLEAVVDSAQQAVQQNRSQFGSEHPLTLSSMSELGRAFHGHGRVGKALQVFQELLPLSEKVLGPYHADTLATLDAICEELWNMGKRELSLAHLIDERQHCEQALGPQHERTIRVLIDIANMSKLLDKTDDASSAFALALDRSQKGLGPSHELTLAILNDLRRSHEPLLPSREQMTALLRQTNLPVSTEPFPNTVSTDGRDTLNNYRVSISSSLGYEAANAMQLRLGPLNGEPKPLPPVFILRHFADSSKVRLKAVSTQTHLDNSFQSLINRSIEILPREWISENSNNYIAFLKSLKSLDELLAAKENPVWFFQHRESFLQQTTFPRWDPNSMDRYILLPIEAGLVNPEDCIFISHYWRTQPHPDPDGDDLRQLQQLLIDGFWAGANYLWIDWACLPQWERTVPQQQYFSRTLPTIPRLVRDCVFVGHFLEFQPRLWVLFEFAAFTFHRAEAVGLPCTDTFRKHLLQMNGDSVRLILDRYGYKCTNKGDREQIITWLEILLALWKTVPSIHTRRQILDIIDNSRVRSCIHKEAGVEIDKERGILKANGTTYQFNPFPMDDGIPHTLSEVSIAGDYETRLGKALLRADESYDDAGVGEIAREYGRAGDYKIAEVLHRRAVAKCETLSTSHDLATNLENQERYKEAAAQRRRDLTRPDAPISTSQQLIVLEQKQALLDRYLKWKFQPLEATVQMRRPTIARTRFAREPAVRNGLRRLWLQRLDQSVWQCEDPAVMKSLEEQGLGFEEKGNFSEAQQIHWRLLRWRRESLGPCHVETRRSISSLARAYRLAGDIPAAHQLCLTALAVCDFTLGPNHPESRAALGDLAAVVLLQNKPGVARGYYRQQLERTLMVVNWDDPEAFQPKFFLQAIIGDDYCLQIVQGDEETTVEIRGYSPEDARSLKSNPALAMANDNMSHSLLEESENEARGEGQSGGKQEKPKMILSVEDAAFLFQRYIIARPRE